MSEEIVNMLNAYREMEASCRARGMQENAKRWQGLAEAAQRDLERWQKLESLKQQERSKS